MPPTPTTTTPVSGEQYRRTHQRRHGAHGSFIELQKVGPSAILRTGYVDPGHIDSSEVVVDTLSLTPADIVRLREMLALFELDGSAR